MSAALAIALLAAIAFGVTSALRLEQPWLQPWSVLRAVVQLGLLTLVLRVAIAQVEYVVVFLVVMVLAAASLVGRRLGWSWRRTVGGAGVIAASAAVPVLVVFGSGAVALRPNLVLAGLPVLEAATFQVVVLASLLAAGAIAVALWTLILGAPLTLPADRPGDPVPAPAGGPRSL